MNPPSASSAGKCPTLEFTHAGRTRTLSKAARVQDQLRKGLITLEDAQAAPWYLRAKLAGKERPFKLCVADKAAIAAAKDILNGHQDQPQQFSAWLAEKEARRGLTLGQLAGQWFKDGCPFDGEAARTAEAAAQLRNTVTRALNFWSERRVASVTHAIMAEFVAWRRQHVRSPRPLGGEGQGEVSMRIRGSRSADLELAALSCLCQWALLTDRIEKNPFAERKRFQKKDDIGHCHERMPDDDQQLHRVLSYFFLGGRSSAPPQPDAQPDPAQILAGGYLAFTALTGLRPGEPALLRRVLPVKEFPTNLGHAPAGLVYPMPDGTRRMKVARLKRGQNPAIILHPALADFLEAWHAWLDQTFPLPLGGEGQGEGDARLFPIAQDAVAGRLERACETLQLPAMKPHGFGRAYYVRVRRSQGIDDAAIAVELGQSSNGDLIRSVYGDPRDPVGGNLHDWLPAGKNEQGETVATPAAWTTLREALPKNLLKVNFP